MALVPMMTRPAKMSDAPVDYVLEVLNLAQHRVWLKRGIHVGQTDASSNLLGTGRRS